MTLPIESADGATPGDDAIVAATRLANATNATVRLAGRGEFEAAADRPLAGGRPLYSFEFPEKQVLWTGLPYQAHALLGRKVIGLSVLAGNMLHLGGDTVDLAGSSKKPADWAAERIALLAKTPFAGDRWINLRRVLGDYDYAYPEQTELPPAPRLEGVDVAANQLTIRLRGANGVPATVTLNYALEVIAATVNGEPRSVPGGTISPDTR